MSDLNNPPAFPRDERYIGHNGMTLRDWFAGQALGGMDNKDDSDFSSDDHKHGFPEKIAGWSAAAAYRIADAMLAERGKP